MFFRGTGLIVNIKPDLRAIVSKRLGISKVQTVQYGRDGDYAETSRRDRVRNVQLLFPKYFLVRTRHVYYTTFYSKRCFNKFVTISIVRFQIPLTKRPRRYYYENILGNIISAFLSLLILSFYFLKRLSILMLKTFYYAREYFYSKNDGIFIFYYLEICQYLRFFAVVRRK